MSYDMNKHRSRRHLAALTFLSNISLDGTHRDTNLGRYYNIDKSLASSNSANKEKFEKENQPSISSASLTDVSGRNILKENKNNPSSDPATDLSDNRLSRSTETFLNQSAKQRCVLNDNAGQINLLHKRASHQISLIEKNNLLCSNESIGLYTGASGYTGRARKLSLSLSEVSVPPSKDVKCLRIEARPKLNKDGRFLFLSKNKIPCHVFSCLPYYRINRQECLQKDVGRKRNTSGTRPLSTISDSIDPAHIIGLSYLEEITEISFSNLLIPSRGFTKNKKTCFSDHVDHIEAVEKVSHHPGVTRCFSFEPATHKATREYIPTGSRSSSFSVSGNKVLFKAMETGDHLWRKSNTLVERDESRTSGNHPPITMTKEYVPNMLDDPELRAGKHRKLLRFPSYMTSVTDYTKPFELKKELNDKFREKFPLINLTLSKLRSLKRELLKIARQECGIDILTVALAYVYFEKMILKMFVNKQNRKLVAGACLILSAKMNDVKGDVLTNLIEKTETVFRLNRRELLSWELACLVALEFGLHVPAWQVNPHYQRLLFES